MTARNLNPVNNLPIEAVLVLGIYVNCALHENVLHIYIAGNRGFDLILLLLEME